MKTIKHIVFTGGPCGGKTTGLSYVRQKLEEKGFSVFIIPEAATLCIENGLSPINSTIGSEIAQMAMMDLTLNMERIWINAILKTKHTKVVVLHDRGIPDSKAYTKNSLYHKILNDLGLNHVGVRDGRYDAVFHMQSAAIGAEEFYTLANNKARYENVDEAKLADTRIVNAWIGHPHFRIIDNSTDFSSKLHRLFQEICHFIGVPVPIEKEKKFLVRFDSANLPKDCEHIDIEQLYLSSSDPDKVVRIRKRGQNGYSTFYKTIKMSTGKPGERIEFEEPITESEYNFGLDLIQFGTKPIQKIRTCFMFQNQYFELDKFADESVLPEGCALLELEMTDLNAKIQIPEWIEIVEDVTDNPFYSNQNISTRISVN